MPVRTPARLAPVVLVAAVALIGSQSCFTADPTYLTIATDSTGPVCIHLMDPLSDRICPLTSIAAEQFRPQDVVAETLVVHTSDNRTIRLAIPNRTDAIFIGQYAMSNFLLRHYDATNPDKARELRQVIRGRYR